MHDRVLRLICYASHPSEAVRRYNRRKLHGRRQALQARHAVHRLRRRPRAAAGGGAAGPHDVWVGDVAAISRLAAHHALAVEGQ